MTDKIDTSPAAVAALCELISCNLEWDGLDGTDRDAYEQTNEMLPALAAERDRLVAQLAEARKEGWRRGIEAAAQAADDWFYDPENDAVTDTRLSATIRALPLPADLREVVDMISGK